MKFLIDAQLPPALCRWLKGHGYDADHVVTLGMLNATDLEIAKYAFETQSIILSKDEDFVILRSQHGFWFVWLRCGNATNARLSQWLDARWAQIESLLQSGEQFVEVR